MWTTLERVLTPASLEEALELVGRPGHALAGGGRFLADARPAEVHTLVALRGLLPRAIEPRGEALRIGAGCTLEELRRAALDHGLSSLAQALAAHTPEPNLRHQSLLGGALVHDRGRGPLAALCLAGDARLHLHGLAETQPFALWQGDGLVTALELPDTTHLAFAGLSLLPASRPLVFAAAGRSGTGLRLTAGGKDTELVSLHLADGEARPLHTRASTLAVHYRDDGNGSAAWKTRCLATLLQDLEALAWN